MDPTLAAVLLLAVALVVLTAVILRRLAVLQADIHRGVDLEPLARRLDALAEHVEQRRLGAQLEARLTEFGEAMDRLSTAVADLQSSRPASGSDGPAPAFDLAGVVRNHLAVQGFEGIQLVTDTSAADGLSGDVAFEARRRGVVHKGRLTVRDGVVIDESIRSAYSTFP